MDFALNEEAVERLLACGSGDAALLYIYIISRRDWNEAGAARETGFSVPRLRGALKTLEAAGLMEERRAEQPADKPEESVKAVYSTEEIAREIEEKSEFFHLKTEAERRLGRKLSPSELGVLLGIFNDLGLPTEVLYQLLTFCVEDIERFYGPGRRPTMKQLEREAYRWSHMELDSPEKASEYITKRKRAAGESAKAADIMGIGGRRLSRSEEGYITKWLEWGFGLEEIELAYDKTVLKTKELNWRYMNSILKNWNEKGIRRLEDIERGDRPAQRSESEQFEQESIDWVKNYRKKKAEEEEN